MTLAVFNIFIEGKSGSSETEESLEIDGTIATKLHANSSYHVLYELWPVPPDGLDGLENVYFAMLDHLLDARVGSAVHAAPASTVAAKQINKIIYFVTYVLLCTPSPPPGVDGIKIETEEIQ